MNAQLFKLSFINMSTDIGTVKTVKPKMPYLLNYETLSSAIYSAYFRVTYQQNNLLIRAIHNL